MSRVKLYVTQTNGVKDKLEVSQAFYFLVYLLQNVSWLRTVEDDLHLLNFGLAMVRRRAMDRPAWHLLVDAATSS